MTRARGPLLIVKLGGSLATSPRLIRWLAAIAEAALDAVVVPGGGPFADQVRELQRRWGLDDPAAHRLAIGAMELFAAALVALDPRLDPAADAQEISGVLGRGRVAVWMPARMTIGRPEIPESWDVTSDSLAAWLAARLGAKRLLLVKSAEPPAGTVPAAELARAGMVDRAFPGFLARSGVEEAWCVGPDGDAQAVEALGRGGPLGTRIVTDP